MLRSKLQISFVLSCLLASSQSSAAVESITPPSPDKWPTSGYACSTAFSGKTILCKQSYTDKNGVKWGLTRGPSDDQSNGKPMPTQTTVFQAIDPISRMNAVQMGEKTSATVLYGSTKNKGANGIAAATLQGEWKVDGNEFTPVKK